MRFFFVLIFLSVFASLNAQHSSLRAEKYNEESHRKIKDTLNSFLKNKNAIYGTVGLWIGAAANLSYERFLFYLNSKKKLAFSIRFGYGVGYELGFDKYDTYFLMAHLNFGKLNHFFELGAGTGTLYSKQGYRIEIQSHKRFPNTIPYPNRRDFIYFLPGTTIGYKYHSNNFPVIIRTGAGFIEGFYFSLGGIF